MKKIKIEFLFAWYDLWIGAFYDKKNRWLYILPIPMFGIIIKLNSFKNWMDQLKTIACKNMPTMYKENDKWHEEFWKKTYYDKGFTPADTWKDYTTMVY